MANGKDFLGKSIKFPLQVDSRTGKIALSSFEESIKETVGIVIRTYPGERLMHPDFGCGACDFLFETLDEAIRKPTEAIRDALTLFEPRIEDVDVTLSKDDDIEGALIVTVSYKVRETNNRYSHVYPFYMTEGNKEVNVI